MPTEPGQRRTIHAAVRRCLVSGTAAIALTACALGQRPVLEPVPVIDDAAAQVVLERLTRAGSVAFTARYDIIPSTTGVATTAFVRQQNGRVRITVGDVDYLIDATSTRTCRRTSGECVDFIDDAAISNLNVTHRFWSDGIAARLAVDAARRVGFSEGHTETIAGRPAACADVPVLGGDVVYCALDAGIVARYFNADVTIELTSFSDQVDENAFSPEVDPQV